MLLFRKSVHHLTYYSNPKWYWGAPSLWYCTIRVSRSFAFEEMLAWRWQQAQTVLHWSSSCVLWAKQELPKLLGYSFTISEGNWDARILSCFPWLYLLHWGCQLSCCRSLRTTHTFCIPCVCICSQWWFQLAGSWRHPKNLLHNKIPQSILPLTLWFSPRKTVSSEWDAKVAETVATYHAVWWLISFPQRFWAAHEVCIDEKTLIQLLLGFSWQNKGGQWFELWIP